jgi:uncharacterized protein YllA (UPF0747 family)
MAFPAPDPPGPPAIIPFKKFSILIQSRETERKIADAMFSLFWVAGIPQSENPVCEVL